MSLNNTDPTTANNPALEKKQEEIEKANVSEPVVITKAPEVPTTTEVKPEVSELEVKTVKELQAMLSNIDGFEGAELLTSKKQIIAVMKALEKKHIEVPVVAPSTPEGVTMPQVVPGNVETPTERRNWQSKRDRTKAIIDAQPKIRTMIPFDLGEKAGAVAELQINGYKKIVPKNVYIDLPQAFADLVAYSFDQTSKAGQDFLLDRAGIDPETGKTVQEILS